MSKHKTEVKRINGYLKEVTTFFDASGKPISHVINPLMVELKPRDILQLFVGSLLISSSLCFTEEVWTLSIELSQEKVMSLFLVSVLVITTFIYYNFYRLRLRGHIIEFFKRVLATYLICLSSVTFVLFLIDKLPLDQPIIALKRVIIIAFPSLFGAVISDQLK
ncbi:DUF2391 family protein [bacterium]|nr:DUF2391 family protein [bacterium]